MAIVASDIRSINRMSGIQKQLTASLRGTAVDRILRSETGYTGSIHVIAHVDLKSCLVTLQLFEDLLDHSFWLRDFAPSLARNTRRTLILRLKTLVPDAAPQAFECYLAVSMPNKHTLLWHMVMKKMVAQLNTVRLSLHRLSVCRSF